MKKFYSILCAASLVSMGMFAQKGNLVFSTPTLGIDYRVTSLSPNGKWACGLIDDATTRSFVWNLTSGEITELSMQGYTSIAMKVSNDGTVAGSFETTKDTPNNVPTETYGIWKNGQWTDLEIENKENGTKLMRDGYAAAISANGKYVGGIGSINKKYYPVVWEDGKVKVIDNVSGSVYDISDDGKIVCGWTTHPQKKNRTGVVWILGEDGKYKKTYTDLDSPWSSGPFCVASDISTNKRYVVAFNRVLDLTTGKYVEHDFSYAISGFELTGVTNNGEAFGYHDTGEFPGGTDCKAIKIAKLESDKDTITDMREYLVKLGVDLKQYPYIQRTLGISDDENTYAFYAIDANSVPHSIIVKLNVDTTAMAPIALKNRQIEGVNANHLMWKAPLKNIKALKGYNVYRNGSKINTALLTTPEYMDRQLNAGDYTYAVTAVYGNKESEKSEEITSTINAHNYQKPLNLLAMQSSFNDVRLVWENPYTNLPAIKYFEHNEVNGSLGGGQYSFEAAISARQSELALYKEMGYKISQISFVPKSAQNSWTVNFYTTDDDTTPIYSEKIPNESIVYGIENFYTLKNPVEIPEGKEVIMSIAIDATNFGGFNVLGIASKKADPRYSDLIRQKGEKNFYSMYESGINNEESPVEYNICWAMSMHFSKENEIAENTVKQYLVSVNNKTIGSTTDKKYRIENLEDGNYKFEVVAEYANGQKSSPALANLNVIANKSVFQAVTPTVVTEFEKATVTWEAPLDNDKSFVSFANTPNSGGFVGSEKNQYNYAVATRYFGEKLKAYDGFEITGFRFYPLCDAEFTFILKENGEDLTEVSMANGEGYTKNQWNTVKLEKPIKLNRYSEYTLVLDCYDVTPKQAPIGLDSQVGYPNVSDLYSQDGENFKSLITEGGKNANWMIGLEIASSTPKQLPLEGYNVYLTNKKQTESPIKENQYVFENLKNGPYQVRINPVYTGFGEKKSKAVTFVINVPSGIEDMNNTTFNIIKNANFIEVKGTEVSAINAINLNGCVVAKSQSNLLDISKLTDGVYVLNIKSEGKTISAKITISK